ncbi:hypothetical protein Hamer_G000346, partial [Homarus americanus]
LIEVEIIDGMVKLIKLTQTMATLMLNLLMMAILVAMSMTSFGQLEYCMPDPYALADLLLFLADPLMIPS